ncbi:MAG: hypothetical protein ACK6EB_03640, partial [Planctomyces sp.]
DGLTVTGTGSVRINRLGATINETIATPTGSVLVNFDTNTDVTQNRSTLKLQFQNYDYASGDSIDEKTNVASLKTRTLAASNLNAFLGVNYNATGEFGVKDTGAGVAMLVEKQGTNPTKYAISTTGGTVGIVGLAGVDGLTLTGNLAARVNTTGGAVNNTITLPDGETVAVQFGATEAAAVFQGTVTATVAQFATVTGSFAVSKSGSKLTIAAAGVTAQVGTSDLGVKVTDGKLGVVVKT